MTARVILVIEDDLSIRRGMVAALRHAAYEVREAGDGVAGAELALAGDLDLVLLDLVLPRRDGLEVLRRIRTRGPGAAGDRGHGARRGGGARARAWRWAPTTTWSSRSAPASCWPGWRRCCGARPGGRSRSATCCSRPARSISTVARCGRRTAAREELSKLEADVLRYLAKSGDRLVSRDELLARVWQQKPHLIATRSVDMTIARLRKKLGGRDGAGHRARQGVQAGPVIRRPLLVAAAFAVSALVVFGALAHITAMTLALERSEAAARQRATHEENVRIALWRLDAILTGLIAQENTRPAALFRAAAEPSGLPPGLVRARFEVGADHTLRAEPPLAAPAWVAALPSLSRRRAGAGAQKPASAQGAPKVPRDLPPRCRSHVQPVPRRHPRRRQPNRRRSRRPKRASRHPSRPSRDLTRRN